MLPINKITKDYQVIHTVDLNQLAHSPSSTLYRELVSHVTSEFQPDQRFVFLNYNKIDKEILDHFVDTLQYLDISSYFAIVVSNQPGTVDYLNSKNLDFDVRLVTCNDVDMYTHTTIPQFANNVMCAHAWSGVHLTANGDAKICCEYIGFINDKNGNPYNIKNHNVEDIITSDYMSDIRQQFRQGITPSGCKNCTSREAVGAESKRTLTPFKLENIYGYIDWESDECNNPKFIGGHLGNLCNLKCRICSPNLSSQIAAEEIKHTNNEKRIKTILIDHNWSNQQANFWDTIKQDTSLVNFEFLGGEPLLLKDNINFLEHLLKSGHSKNCIFEFVSNGTQFNHVIAESHKFQRFTVTLSIDNVGDRFEYERNNAVWSEVESNVNRFVQLTKQYNSVNIGICTTVSIMNVLYLPELIKWMDSKDITHYYYNMVNFPTQLSLDSLTTKAKQLVLDTLHSADLTPDQKQKLDPVLQFLKQSKTSDGEEFCNYIRTKDKIRKQDFSLTHTEIAEAMGYKL